MDKFNFFDALRFLKKYIIKFRLNLLLFYFGWFIDMLFGILIPILSGVLINQIIYYRNMNTFLKISGLFAIVTIFSCLLYFFIYAQHHYIMSMFTYHIRMDIFRKIHRAEAKYLNNNDTGDFILSIQSYAIECVHFIVRNMIHFTNSIILSVFILVYIFILSWHIGIIILLGAPLLVFVTSKFNKRIRICTDHLRDYNVKYISWLFERLSALRDIRVLGAINKASREFNHNHKKIFKVSNKVSFETRHAQNMVELLTVIIRMAIYGAIAYYTVYKNLSMGSLIVVIAYYDKLRDSITLISDSLIDVPKRVSYIKHIYDLVVNVPVESEEYRNQTLNIVKSDIHMKNIGFIYAGSSEVIKSINLDIKGGERFAIVGHSGCGKTTLAYLLLNFYSPDSGEIIIDGQNIANCSLKSIRKNIGIIQQDILIYNGTIRENLLLADYKATDDELKNACKNAGIYDFIEALPEGFDTVLGSNGILLSGGQKQRLVLSRIYLKNPKVIIFDEATSSVDTETEAVIHNAWNHVLAGRTAIIISHRLSSVLLCDRVAIINGGTITDIGEPAIMMKKNKNFQTLFSIKEDNETCLQQ